MRTQGLLEDKEENKPRGVYGVQMDGTLHESIYRDKCKMLLFRSEPLHSVSSVYHVLILVQILKRVMWCHKESGRKIF